MTVILGMPLDFRNTPSGPTLLMNDGVSTVRHRRATMAFPGLAVIAKVALTIMRFPVRVSLQVRHAP